MRHSHARQPWTTGLGRRHQQPWASKEPCMPNPDPRPTPPARQPAASQGRSRGRRPRPGPPGFTYEVQLLGGEAGRLLAQEQTEAIAAVLAWLATHPPMPTATTGPAATAVGKPGGQSTATRTGTRPAQPSSAGPADGSTQRGTGGSGGWADTHAEPAEALRRAGRPGGWRVVVDGSDRGAGAGGGAGGGGPAGWGGRTGAGCAPSGATPLGLASVAWVGDRHGPAAARQP